MESPNSLYNNINNTNNKDGIENGTENLVIPSNFLISTKEIIARFPHNKRVGHYLLGRKLGEGSFAKVKEGLHTLTGQKVAIKVIDKKKAKEDAYVSKNMRREGKLLQMIIHPNIIQLYELMETENSYYLVTELCEGGDLMDYICARKHLSETCTRKFIRQIISAVDYLHRIGILHRDLKIENLLLDKNLNIKLIDFGLSNYTKSELCITQCGSPAYAAPELLAHKKYGSKVDVWSIGVNMYAMLTGNLPFTVEPFNIKALYNKMMKNEMNAIPEHLSKSGEDLLRKLLNPDPSKRISLKEAMEHPWINEGYSSILKPFPYPNKPTEDQVNPTILRYMNSNMEFNVNEIADNIKSNKPSSSLATYYLLLNKVKTMLMKIDPKKDKMKPGNDIKSAVRDLKQIKPQQAPTPTVHQVQSHNNNHSPNTTTTTNTTNTTNTPGSTTPQHTITPLNNTSNNNTLNRTVKTPGATITTTAAPPPPPPPPPTTTATTTNNNNTTTPQNLNNTTPNTLYSTFNKTDTLAKYGSKTGERNISPTDKITTNNIVATIAANVTNATTNSNNNNNTIPGSTFAGAIKTLTQKYKTMHLNNSNSNNNNNNNNNSNNTNESTFLNVNSTNNNNSSNLNTYNYKTTYIHNNNNNNNNNTTINTNNLNNSVNDPNGSNNTSDNTSTNNSDSTSSSDDANNANNHKITNGNHNNKTSYTPNLTNRNSMAATVQMTNTNNKLTNGAVNHNNNNSNNNNNSSTNAEWTQVIKLNGVNNGNKVKSDLNNNTNDFNNNTSSVLASKDQLFSDLTHNSSSLNNGTIVQSIPNGVSSSLSPPNSNLIQTYQFNNTNNSINLAPQSQNTTMNTTITSNVGSGGTSRLNKSPIMKKLTSPITLPAIDAGRSTPQ